MSTQDSILASQNLNKITVSRCESQVLSLEFPVRREPASWAEAIMGLFLNGILGSGGFYL